MILTKARALPRWEWQKTASFPDWKGYTDDTLAMNSMVSFLFFPGQGTLWLEVPGDVEGFSLYVNHVKCDVPPLSGGIWTADISGVTVSGVNTLQLSDIAPRVPGHPVLVHIPYPVVLEGSDPPADIHAQALALVSDLIGSDIAGGFPGAQLAVVHNGRLAVNRAWGSVRACGPDGAPGPRGAPVTVDTLFDLASVTKMFTVNYAVQKLVTDGLLDIDAPITALLGSRFADETLDLAYACVQDAPDLPTQAAWKRALRVRDVLCHQAGFPASPHYNDPDYDLSLQAVGAPGSNPCHAACREETLTALCRTPLLYAPGTRTLYSDADYMLLTFVVEAVTGRRLDRYMKETFFAPLGLSRISFLPPENGFSADDCAATEPNGNTRGGRLYFDGIRTHPLQGEVHDERAWHCMEGVSGHAGLFSNAADLARLAFVMLTGGYGARRFFSRAVLDAFTAPVAIGRDEWGLGWWREGEDRRVWYFGTQASPGTVGHQGWTGTLVMIDPARALVIVYLTNKLHSRVLGQTEPFRFAGSFYTSSTLGFVPQILSIGMDCDRDLSDQLSRLAADMAAGSLKLIPDGAGADHPGVKNALAKVAVLRKWAGGDPALQALADRLYAALPHPG